ncbi:hypothetical protein PDJAM_G00096060 [Pangasius djambal]|uniref:Uncharacterized protein n=1 Tax=Pangasius djambal TaxID=1691987 RepID=A0ACC5Z762_9TELE|nr:hypothetical protein [Pangasius djambal]
MPKANGAASHALLTPAWPFTSYYEEANVVASPVELQPETNVAEADMAASLSELQCETNEVVSSSDLEPEADVVASPPDVAASHSELQNSRPMWRSLPPAPAIDPLPASCQYAPCLLPSWRVQQERQCKNLGSLVDIFPRGAGPPQESFCRHLGRGLEGICQVKEFIHSELLAQIYSTGDHSALMTESPEQAVHREHVLRTHSALKEALSILSEISTSTLSTLLSAPVEGPRLQSSIINRGSPSVLCAPKKTSSCPGPPTRGPAPPAPPATPVLLLPSRSAPSVPKGLKNKDSPQTLTRPNRSAPSIPRRQPPAVPSQKPHEHERIPNTKGTRTE